MEKSLYFSTGATDGRSKYFVDNDPCKKPVGIGQRKPGLARMSCRTGKPALGYPWRTHLGSPSGINQKNHTEPKALQENDREENVEENIGTPLRDVTTEKQGSIRPRLDAGGMGPRSRSSSIYDESPSHGQTQDSSARKKSRQTYGDKPYWRSVREFLRSDSVPSSRTRSKVASSNSLMASLSGKQESITPRKPEIGVIIPALSCSRDSYKKFPDIEKNDEPIEKGKGPKLEDIIVIDSDSSDEDEIGDEDDEECNKETVSVVGASKSKDTGVPFIKTEEPSRQSLTLATPEQRPLSSPPAYSFTTPTGHIKTCSKISPSLTENRPENPVMANTVTKPSDTTSEASFLKKYGPNFDFSEYAKFTNLKIDQRNGINVDLAIENIRKYGKWDAKLTSESLYQTSAESEDISDREDTIQDDSKSKKKRKKEKRRKEIEDGEEEKRKKKKKKKLEQKQKCNNDEKDASNSTREILEVPKSKKSKKEERRQKKKERKERRRLRREQRKAENGDQELKSINSVGSAGTRLPNNQGDLEKAHPINSDTNKSGTEDRNPKALGLQNETPSKEGIEHIAGTVRTPNNKRETNIEKPRPLNTHSNLHTRISYQQEGTILSRPDENSKWGVYSIATSSSKASTPVSAPQTVSEYPTIGFTAINHSGSSKINPEKITSPKIDAPDPERIGMPSTTGKRTSKPKKSAKLVKTTDHLSQSDGSSLSVVESSSPSSIKPESKRKNSKKRKNSESSSSKDVVNGPQEPTVPEGSVQETPSTTHATNSDVITPKSSSKKSKDKNTESSRSKTAKAINSVKKGKTSSSDVIDSGLETSNNDQAITEKAPKRPSKRRKLESSDNSTEEPSQNPAVPKTPKKNSDNTRFEGPQKQLDVEGTRNSKKQTAIASTTSTPDDSDGAQKRMIRRRQREQTAPPMISLDKAKISAKRATFEDSPSPQRPVLDSASEARLNSSQPATPSRRVPAGTSVIIPPPLEAENFGLIQEEVKDNPYKLLVVVVFLQKTKGSQAIPVFREFCQRWPTPEALIHHGSQEEVAEVFRALGLQNQRAKSVFSLAKRFVENNPYNRPKGPEGWVIRDGYRPKDPMGLNRRWGCIIGDVYGAGKYAIDSWRIFAMKPGEGGFLDGTEWGRRQKKFLTVEGEKSEALVEIQYSKEFAAGDEEWRRYTPDEDPLLDKELRAYVKWMQAKDAAGIFRELPAL